MNRRASYADIAIVIAAVVFTSLLLVNKDPNIRATATIGGYQHDLMDSYIVAENSRSYVEHSYQYAIQQALHSSKYCTTPTQKNQFMSQVENYLQKSYTEEIPIEVNGFEVTKPFPKAAISAGFYDVSDAIVLISKENEPELLVITADPISVTNLNPNFKVDTSVDMKFVYDIDELCLQNQAASSSITDTPELIDSEELVATD
jgi:hypothetical protein